MLDRTQIFETTRCMCLASRRAARRITRRFDRVLRPLGLRTTQFTLLAALYLGGPRSIGALAELLDAERSTVSRNLALAEEHGWVALRADDTDARTRLARITTPGERLLQTAFPVWRNVQSELVRELGPEASDALHRLAGGPCVLPLPHPTIEQN